VHVMCAHGTCQPASRLGIDQTSTPAEAWKLHCIVDADKISQLAIAESHIELSSYHVEKRTPEPATHEIIVWLREETAGASGDGAGRKVQ
jgi:hypothetical protein